MNEHEQRSTKNKTKPFSRWDQQGLDGGVAEFGSSTAEPWAPTGHELTLGIFGCAVSHSNAAWSSSINLYPGPLSVSPAMINFSNMPLHQCVLTIHTLESPSHKSFSILSSSYLRWYLIKFITFAENPIGRISWVRCITNKLCVWRNVNLSGS